jgi:hypothetical protein
MEAWIRANDMTTNEYPTILSFGRWGASLGLDPASMKAESWINTWDEFESSAAIPTSVWTHVALVYSNKESRLFINGQPAGTKTSPEVQTAAGTDLRIGAADIKDGVYTKFDGCIDEVRLSNRSRSPNWIWADWINVSSNNTLLAYGSVASDNDGDGIEDGWEIASFGNLTAANEFSDWDHDGFSDYSEYIAGTDPNDAQSLLTITAIKPNLATAKLLIVWQSESGQAYNVESTTNISDSIWTPVASEIIGLHPTNTLEITQAKKRFYRIKLKNNLP